MLETERLFLRPLDADDVEQVFAMRSDADVMRFIRAPQTRRESADWIQMVSSRWETTGIGFCAVIEKSSDEFVGWCGLWRLKETDEIEIGYAVAKDFQGKGYATEAAAAVLGYGFETLRLKKIVAVARPENAASRRVMEKLGMRYDYTGEFYSKQLVHYTITKNDYFGNRKTASPAHRAG